jgi:pantoate--beta-alanine ligase
VIERAADITAACDAFRAEGLALGYVPTMGFFHDGHLALMRAAAEERDRVVLSIFVNPLQFGPTEDFAAYPRDLERDLRLAQEQGVHLAFVPDVTEMYPDGRPETTVDPGSLGDRLEGAARPGHFRGVCTVLARLFHLIGPSRGYFGEKDAQQVAVVRHMVRDLAFPVEIETRPTVREPDGLAMSSRNSYLSAEEREAARCVPAALEAVVEAVHGGTRHASALRDVIRRRVEQEPAAELDYAAIVDDGTFEEIDEVTGPARALIAVRVGKPRLIDNVALPA